LTISRRKLRPRKPSGINLVNGIVIENCLNVHSIGTQNSQFLYLTKYIVQVVLSCYIIKIQKKITIFWVLFCFMHCEPQVNWILKKWNILFKILTLYVFQNYNALFIEPWKYLKFSRIFYNIILTCLSLKVPILWIFENVNTIEYNKIKLVHFTLVKYKNWEFWSITLMIMLKNNPFFFNMIISIMLACYVH